MTELKEFLARMATDPQLLGRFIHDPDAAMQEAELGGEDMSALRSGLPGMIYARLSGVPIKEAFVIRAQIPQQQLQLPLQLPLQQPLQLPLQKPFSMPVNPPMHLVFPLQTPPPPLHFPLQITFPLQQPPLQMPLAPLYMLFTPQQSSFQISPPIFSPPPTIMPISPIYPPPTIAPIYPPPTIAPIFPPPTVMPIFPIYAQPPMQIYSQPYYGWGR